ncbi:MAG TPA: exopolysaccharide Pel transporter PelG, partial [Kofleriaceae bacterium]|nr:exopolysaccharide Pel transporter PelG [Kofleriaceae bacterium]
YAADRVYERRHDQIAAPLRRVLAVTLVGFGAVGAGAMAVLDPPLEVAIPGALLATVVGGQWLLLSAAGGLSSPSIILRAFAVGAPVSVAAALSLSQVEVLGQAGHLIGFGLGQALTLALLLVGTLRALPPDEDSSASIAPAFHEYWLLAAAAFAFHGGLWIDKFLVWLRYDTVEASGYASAAAIAWLSVVPACGFLFVQVETTFHRRFRSFYDSLHGGASLDQLDRQAADLGREVEKTLRGTAVVQACVTLPCLLAAPALARQLGLQGTGESALPWLLLGAAPQVMALSATLLLYYFDYRGSAALAAATQLLGNGLGTLAIESLGGPLGAGYALSCLASCAVAVLLLFRRMTGLIERTFQEQPFGAEA